MVLQKRLDYGFNGYQVPATPRATRSARVSIYCILTSCINFFVVSTCVAVVPNVSDPYC